MNNTYSSESFTDRCKYLRAMRSTLVVAPDKMPFCSTCQKAGLSREEYTNHWTRKSVDPNSEIVCPLILSSTCKHCNKQGHWKKYCPDLMLFSNRISSNFKPLKKEEPLILDDYEPRFRPRSPDYPPPWLESATIQNELAPIQPEPIKKIISWADIVASKK